MALVGPDGQPIKTDRIPKPTDTIMGVRALPSVWVEFADILDAGGKLRGLFGKERPIGAVAMKLVKHRDPPDGSDVFTFFRDANRGVFFPFEFIARGYRPAPDLDALYLNPVAYPTDTGIEAGNTIAITTGAPDGPHAEPTALVLVAGNGNSALIKIPVAKLRSVKQLWRD